MALTDNNNDSIDWNEDGRPIRWHRCKPHELSPDGLPASIWMEPETLSGAILRKVRRPIWKLFVRLQHRSLHPSTLDLLERYFKPSVEKASLRECKYCEEWNRWCCGDSDERSVFFQTRVWNVYSVREGLAKYSNSKCPICRLRVMAVAMLLQSEKPPQTTMACRSSEWPGQFELWIFDGKESYRALFELYATECDHNYELDWGQHINPNSQDDCALEHILSMVTECDNKHIGCKEMDTPALPTRVLDISNPSRPVLIEANQERARYTSLSYCWGKAEFIQTTKATLEGWKNGIPWKSLPRTFQEAIRLTVKMGVRYIWIDALCILQDCPNDWQIESGRMCEIYANSYLTIAATCGTNPHDGFLGLRSLTKRISRVDAGGNQRDVFTRPSSYHLKAPYPGYDDRSIDPLLTRGWAYQERRLAKRVLHFTHIEAIFTCVRSTMCECHGWHGYDGDIQKRREEPVKSSLVIVLLEWGVEVTVFSALSLTLFKDRLPALSGLAQQYSGHNLGRYLSGIWESSLPGSLFWDYGHKDTQLAAPDQYIAPSWSWASFPGSCHAANEYITGDDLKWSSLPCVLEVECVPLGKDPFGAVSRGHIKVHGRMKYLTAGEFWRMRTNISPYPSFDFRVEDDIEKDEEYELALLGFRGHLKDLDFTILKENPPRVAYRVMILQRSQTVLGAFERIGIMPSKFLHATTELVNLFEKIELSEVVIV